MRGWVRDRAGVRTPINSSGLLIGRSPTCTIVLDDPQISRHQVLLLPTADSVLVLPLGRKPIDLRGAPCTSPTPATHGDVFTVGAAQFHIELERAHQAEPWLLSVGGVRYPISKPVFTIGAGDDLDISAWPANTCSLHQVNGALFLELSEPCEVHDALSQSGGFSLKRGSRICREGIEVEVVGAPPSIETFEETAVPTQVVLEFVPDGALLRLRQQDEFTVFVPQKRADLVAALLKPQGGVAGEWVDDEALMRRIWGTQSASRNQLNVLVHRTRCSLTEAGLNGPALIERAPGGGATRFRVASPRHVTVL